ncbi:MAG: hypothetical protein Q8S19_10335, partial [Bacillota bacterium]|nr:hypothetical protein [Bacillota bacterium]
LRTVANNEQQTNGEATAQIEDLLRALPEGTTVEQLLLNLPKESPVVSTLLKEFNVNSDTAQEVANDSQAVIDLPHIAGDLAPLVKSEVGNDRAEDLQEFKDLPAAVEKSTVNVEDTISPLTQVPPEASMGQPRQRPEVSMSQQQRSESTPQPQRIEAAPVMSGVPQTAVPLTAPSLPAVSAESLQQLRTEIISFSNNPVRPTITLEVAPPEYGRVVVSAERDAAGQVTVRLVVETPAAKQAMAQQLPQAFAGATSTSTTISVFTTEEYQEFREEQRERNSDRNKQQRERRQRERTHEVEFVI